MADGEHGWAGQLMLATVVQRHNAVGRAYFALIKPFHRRIVRALVRRALGVGSDARGTHCLRRRRIERG
jgi:hypothetical protein